MVIHLLGNWDGFDDPESGIGNYTWACGTEVGKRDIVEFNDPHSHLSHKSHWTHTGHASGLHLADGPYYMTVQAMNDIVFGGSLVTTVSHSFPYIIDTSPPIFYSVDDYVYDYDFNALIVWYNLTDPESGIYAIEFGLGKHKHDVSLRPYEAYGNPEYLQGSLAVKNVDIEEGKPAWIRILAYNNGELSTLKNR